MSTEPEEVNAHGLTHQRFCYEVDEALKGEVGYSLAELDELHPLEHEQRAERAWDRDVTVEAFVIEVLEELGEVDERRAEMDGHIEPSPEELAQYAREAAAEEESAEEFNNAIIDEEQASLAASLSELERNDPKVRAAAQKLDKVISDLITTGRHRKE